VDATDMASAMNFIWRFSDAIKGGDRAVTMSENR
jgi:hypothetical protein